MPPEHARTFGGGTAETSLHPAVMLALALAIILMLVLKRKYAIVPLLCLTFLVPLGQAVVVGGAHLYVSRIIVIAGLLRLAGAAFSSKEPVFAGGYNAIDSAFLWCSLLQVIAVILLFQEMPALINQIGIMLDSIGAYFLLRFLIRDEQEAYRALGCLAFISLVIAGGMIIEQVKLVNIFGVIGGASAPEFREGKIRSQGVFLHTLLAGAFGATLPPLFVLLWKTGKAKFLACIGLAGSTIITMTSNSSTPLLTYAGGALAICLWPIRKSMRNIRWAMVIGLVLLALVMKAPIWFILAHIDLTGGSSGYHRAELIDQFVNHFRDWFLIGVKDTGSWGLDMWDAQNQFVNVGETGGLLALIFFLVMITRCYAKIGDKMRILGYKGEAWLYWLLGSALFAHLVGFFGVNYFDQVRVSWLALLAMISGLTAPALAAAQNATAQKDEPELAELASKRESEWYSPVSDLRESNGWK